MRVLQIDKEILEFIAVFQCTSTMNLFTDCACYWFAKILQLRFGGDIVYDPSSVHFATRLNGRVYDISGVVDSVDFEDWVEYASNAEDADLIRECCIKLRR